MDLPRRLKQVAHRFFREAQKTRRNRLEIILYHFVTDRENPFVTAGHNVRPAEFERQMRYLQANYEIVPLEEAPQLIRSGQPLSRPAACVCFDDGYQSNLAEALPVLQKLDIPATIFVCPSVLGNADLLWRDKIRYLIDAGLEDDFVRFLKDSDTADRYHFESLDRLSFYRWSKSPNGIRDMTIQRDLERFFSLSEIDAAAMARDHDLFLAAEDVHPNHGNLSFGNHTWSHPLMPLLGLDAQREELKKTDEWLQKHGIGARSLAMPFTPYDENTISALSELNYECLYTVSGRSNRPAATSEKVLTLHRWLAPETAAELHRIL